MDDFSVPYFKRLNNEIETSYENIDRYIEPHKYYIVELSFDENLDRKSITSFIESQLEDKKNAPFCTFNTYNLILLMFSCVCSIDDEGIFHIENGSVQYLCSHYSSIATLHFGKYCHTKILDIPSRTQIFTYIFWKSTNNLYKIVEDFNVDFNNKSLNECISNIPDWNKISSVKKFGKLTKISGDSYVHLSERIDITKKEKYIDFIFSV